jgi:hypothetical protein
MKAHSDALTRIVKADGRKRIEAFRAAEHARNATAMNNERNRKLDRTEHLKLQKAGRDAYKRLLQDMRVDAAQIEALYARTQQSSNDLHRVPPGSSGGGFVVKAPSEKDEPSRAPDPPGGPPDQPPAPADSTRLIVPPFEGLYESYTGQVLGPNTYEWPQLFLDPSWGLAGNIVQIGCSGASDLCMGWGDYVTLIGFWFQMPFLGRLSTEITLQSDGCQHYIKSIDEAGISEMKHTQHSYFDLYMTGSVSTEPPIEVVMSHLVETDPPDGSYAPVTYQQGTIVQLNLGLERTFGDGEFVYIEFGPRDHVGFVTNDVTVDSWLYYRWLVKSVKVIPTPA